MSLQPQTAQPNGAQNDTTTRLLMVETRSAWEGADVDDFLRLAHGFLQAGLALDFFLVQNSVLLLRSAMRDQLEALARTASCRLWVDRYSLNLRGLTGDDVAGCGVIAGTDELVQLMTVPHTKVIWHS